MSDDIQPNEQVAPEQPATETAQLEDGRYSRQHFFRILGGVGIAGASAAFLAACGDENDDNAGSGGNRSANKDRDRDSENTSDDSSDKDKPSDLEIVNYALTLEYLEADFYQQVVESGLFKGKELSLIQSIGDHEQAHVEALASTAKTLGTPAERPKTTFPLDSRDSVLELAATVENLGAAAYLGQAANIRNKEILAAALAIHTVEARHAAALNRLTGKSPTPDGAFAAPATMEEVLEQVKPFIAA